MRILIYAMNFAPELTGIGKYAGEMCEWLCDKGYNVRVITAPPYYPAWEVDRMYSSYLYKKEKLNRVNVLRCPIWVPKYPTAIKRIIHLLSFSISSFPVLLSHLFWRPNIILVVEPPFFCVPSTLFFAKLCNAKTILHIQDFEIDAAFDLGFINSKFIKKLVQKIEKFLMNRFSAVSTISLKMLERTLKKGVPREKTILFPNWVDTKKIFPLDRKSIFKKKLNIDDSTFVALYSGNIGEKHGLELIINAAEKLKNSQELIIFVICGKGAAYQRLRELARELPNIIWLPLQPFELLNELLNLADIHLLPQKENAEDLVMPSKLTGMLASGKPILATAKKGSQIEKIVKHCGKVVLPGDFESFTNSLIMLLGNDRERVELGKKGRAIAISEFSINSVLSDFEMHLTSII